MNTLRYKKDDAVYFYEKNNLHRGVILSETVVHIVGSHVREYLYCINSDGIVTERYQADIINPDIFNELGKI